MKRVNEQCQYNVSIGVDAWREGEREKLKARH